MKFRSEIHLDRSRGFGLVMVAFIIVIMSLLIGSMLRFYTTQTQADISQLLSSRVHNAATSLTEYGLRRALLEEKENTSATNVLFPNIPLDCDDIDDPGDPDDISYPTPNNATVLPGGSAAWQEPFMEQCDIIELKCQQKDIGIDPIDPCPEPCPVDRYYLVEGTAECAVGADNLYRVRRSIQMEARLSWQTRLARAATLVVKVDERFCGCSSSPGNSGKCQNGGNLFCNTHPTQCAATPNTGVGGLRFTRNSNNDLLVSFGDGVPAFEGTCGS